MEDGEVKTSRWIFVAVAASVLLSALFVRRVAESKPGTQDVAARAALSGQPPPRAESDWLNDYPKAQQEAKASNKLLLLNFTGSDWCGWCIRLNRDVFSQPAFKDYASRNLVLLELDFPWPGGPRWKEQSADLKKQNQELAQQYQVRGFPTLVVLDGEGHKLWRFEGYLPGERLIAELEKLRKG
jgi:thioredoxin-related protein